MLSQKDANGNIAPFSNKLKKDNPIKSKSVAKSSKLKTHSSTHKKIQKIHSKKKAETSVFTVAYNVKSRNNWVVPGDESLKVLPNKWHNDKHDKICNVCGGNNHDASKCRHRSSASNLSEKPYVGSEGHTKLFAAKGSSYTRIP